MELSIHVHIYKRGQLICEYMYNRFFQKKVTIVGVHIVTRICSIGAQRWTVLTR